MYGHKRVRARRQDALTRVGWEQLEVLLATWYRGEGYEVEHTGTGASGSRYDGGIDLKLRRPGEYLLVQVKHWNAYKVPHNDVHQLLGLMINEGAAGAIGNQGRQDSWVGSLPHRMHDVSATLSAADLNDGGVAN